MNHQHEHDDYGGLHRDLRATGAAMDRRELFRRAAKLGAGVGVLNLLGCGATPTSPSTTNTNTATTTGAAGGASSVIPSETAGPYPGVQEADASGTVTFTSTYPGCYAGRWPHIHFEVYPSLAAASVANKIATSQIALPKSASDLVDATAGYEASVTNAARVSLASDTVFSDGSALELATVTGSLASGLTATLTVAV